MMDISGKSLLVVEDSDEDFEMLKLFIEGLDINHPIQRCATGDHVLDLLYQEGPYKNSQTSLYPSVILLDLNLPGIDGREVLDILKKDQKFKEIPIVVFTTSSDPKDVSLCYKKGANGYLVKPVQTNELEQIFQSFIEFWLGSNIPPDMQFNPA